MTDENNVESTTEAPPAMKSTDTGTIKAAMEASKAAAEEPAKQPEATQDDPSSGDDADSAGAPQKDKPERLPRWVRERVKRAEETAIRQTEDRLRAELQPTKVETPKVDTRSAAKTLEDFDYDTTAFTEYLVDQRLKAAEREREQESARRERQKAEDSFKKRIDAFEEKAGAGAWEDIESSTLNTDPKYKALGQMIMEEDDGLDLAHYLAKNPDEVERIGGLKPLAMARELAGLSERIKPANLPRKTTNAPPPPKTIQGGGLPASNIYAANLTPAQRIALLRQQRQSRR